MKSVTVVGSGIIGLTSAIILQESGFEVKIVAKEKFEKTLSNKVGAIWFPYEIQPIEKTNFWASLAYKRYLAEANPEIGITFLPFLNAYTDKSNNDWIKQLPLGKVREARKNELPQGIEMAFIGEVPLAEPRLYLPYLFEKFLANGGLFENREIGSLEEVSGLGDWVINCTGLGAKALCEDNDLHPMRGQILRCEKMELPSFADPTKKGALLYVINRSEDTIIGGTDYEDDWNENTEPADTDKILERFNASGIQQNPQIKEVLVGLRPKRSSVRFEFDPKYPTIFHNYGHGGAGYTVAWGCAMEVAEILSKT
ncbi:FAD-dependent oxidoreductase [Algoriphagus sp.]|uniref:FAD-dependent oxidoreductase n=1 Tax=Algoriphagus sp. TaxID=1872435 RepID=UPI0025FAEF9B|nr:FAD-dependent oxidoreductase [Algoriphagus sp.]